MITENRDHPVFTEDTIRMAFEHKAGDMIKQLGCRWDGEQYTRRTVRIMFEWFRVGFMSGEQLTWDVDKAPEILLTWDRGAHE